MALWILLHLLGIILWLGGAAASMAAGLRARREERAGLGAIARAQAAITGSVIGPGALLSTLSGLVLTFRLSTYSGGMAAAVTPLYLMQGAGLAGALVVLFVSVPTAAKLARIDPMGQYAAAFDELRRRQALAASIGGALGLVALLAGAALRG
ncbi:MAG: hypothetical protein NW201_12110 [Gemmatimonadales bacterium]|nr:hypothetical protein [Gemmatimonadales bacterium]